MSMLIPHKSKLFLPSLLIIATLVASAAIFATRNARAQDPADTRSLTLLPDLSTSYEYANLSLPAHFAANAITSIDNTPNNNRITNAGATLGRVLFYDVQLSANNSKSCASCHNQANSFSDPDTLSTGFNGGRTDRHSTSLANGRYYERGRFFWDER
ncbi:MAG: cytochrome c peroxidase, partial [Candidatus Promineifilaceae bacterium]